MAPAAPRTAAILCIGNEILSGKVEETNAQFLSRELWALGVRLRVVVIIPDEIPVIVEHLRRVRPVHDFVITTGGVGPTHDDVTMEAIAEALDRPLVRVPEFEKGLRDFYKERCNDVILRMASVPRGARLTWKDQVFFPLVEVENVTVLPGDPEIMRRKFMSVRESFRGGPFRLAKIFTLLDEGDIANALREALTHFPRVEIGSYPVYSKSDYRVMVTIESTEGEQVTGAKDWLLGVLPRETIVRVESR
jgi:molybdenum cofactor synthesis domain-containing protein